MGTKKKAFELVFNLQWRNKPDNGGGKSNIIGIYDTPTATLNFETFKSYLLKNSGVAGNDARVAYVADNGSEWVIDSQEWFEFALGAFRLKAKLGEVIHLKLDKISGCNMAKKHSNDVETQFDFENAEINNGGAPPEWFLHYMAQLKRDIVDEVTYAVSSKLQSSKDKSQYCTQFPKYEPKRGRKCVLLDGSIEARDFLKSKVERKLEHKLEKLEAKTRKIKEKKQAVLNKFEKEDNEPEEVPLLQEDTKTMFDGASKKPMSALVHHMMGGETYLHTWEVENTGTAQWTDNTAIRLTWGSSEMIPSSTTVSCPPLKPGHSHVIGVRFLIPTKPGAYESYWNFYNEKGRFGNWLCCRIVVDGPLLPSNTILGDDIKIISRESSPWSNIVAADKSTESSKAKVKFESTEIDEQDGILNHISNLTAMMQGCTVDSPSADSDSEWENLEKRIENTLAEGFTSSTNSYGIKENELIVDLSKNKVDVVAKDQELDKSVEALESSRSNNLGEMFKEPHIEVAVSHDHNSSLSSVASNASIVANDGFDVINASLCEEEEEDDGRADTGYVYIVIDGNKLAVPKYILRPDFLSKAEEAPAPTSIIHCDNIEKQVNDESRPVENSDIPLSLTAKLESEIHDLEQNLQEANSYLLCSRSVSTSDSINSTNRLFIFPQNNPGFEVVGSTEDSVHKTTSVSLSGDSTHVYTWANSQSTYNYVPDLTSTTSYKIDSSTLTNQKSATPLRNVETLEHVPNYQQTGKITPNLPTGNPLPQASSSVPSFSQASVPTAAQAQATSVKSSGHNLPVHILPENLVSGAVNVASSAINTARSVINMIVPPKSEPGRWVNGHWVSQNPESTRAKNLMILTDMGFWDPDLNATLLARYDDDINKVVAELLNLA